MWVVHKRVACIDKIVLEFWSCTQESALVYVSIVMGVVMNIPSPKEYSI
jgi:hypothetical protein